MDRISPSIGREVDEEAGVVLYTVMNKTGVAVTAVPIEQTKFGS